MVNINLSNDIYSKWNDFYKKHNKLDYPSLKNFTEKKLSQIMEVYDSL